MSNIRSTGISSKAFIASVVGGGLELYDFTIFGFLAVVFSPLFFPVDNKVTALLLGYMTFAIGNFCKPIGAIIFGHIGDRYGRRVALYISLVIMGCSTLAIGVLPTYATIGISAPIILVTVRILQGLSVGGEVIGGAIFAIEHTPKHSLGFVGGLLNAGTTAGISVGSLAGYLCTLPSMPEWAWRLPFLLGFLIILFGIFIRKNVAETPVFKSIRKEEISNIPLLQGLKQHYKQFILIMLITGFPGVAFYLDFIYLPTFFATLPEVSDSFARFSGTLSSWCLVILLPVFGYYSDKFNRTIMMKTSTILVSLLALIIFPNFNHLNAYGIVLAQIVFAVALAMFNGPWCAFTINIFQKNVRYSCLATGNSLAAALFGGTAPLVGLQLTSMHNGNILLAIYMVTWGILGFIGVHYLGNYSKNEQYGEEAYGIT